MNILRVSIKKIKLILFIKLLIISITINVNGQNDNKCIELDELMKLIGKVQESTLLKQIKKDRVNFELNYKIIASLARAGVSDELIETIGNNKCSIQKIRFEGCFPFSGCSYKLSEDRESILFDGTSEGYPGVSIPSKFTIGNKRTLKIKIENSSNSVFTNYKRMLKIFAGKSDGALYAKNNEIVSQGDKEFILQHDGVVEYTIPNSLVADDGSFVKLGFTLAPGTYKDLRISAWFSE